MTALIPRPIRHRLRRTPWAPAALLVLACALGPAQAQTAPPPPDQPLATGPGHYSGHPGAHPGGTHYGRHPAGPHGGGHLAGPHGGGHPTGPHGGLMARWFGPGLDRMLDAVQATPEQRAQIRRIAGAARDELRAQRAAAASRGDRSAMMAAWSAETIDVAALERQRAQAAERRDLVGRRMLQAMVEIGTVLRPEQRKMLADQARQLRPGRPRADRGGDGLFDVYAATATD